MENEGLLSHSLRTTFPVFLGYIPLGMAFGLLLVTSGYEWFWAPLLSLFVYAVAGQILGIALLAAGAGMAEIGVATFLINTRHAFYGLSLLNKFSITGRWKPYLVFALTDETYALLTTVEAPKGNEAKFYLYVSALDHGYWILGGLLGALLGSVIGFDMTGLGFVLTALFVVLVIEQYVASKGSSFPVLAAMAAGLLGIAFFRSDLMLLASIVIGCVMLMVHERMRSGEKEEAAEMAEGIEGIV
jgi:4-azaleucine resistance transporter AzlC